MGSEDERPRFRPLEERSEVHGHLVGQLALATCWRDQAH